MNTKHRSMVVSAVAVLSVTCAAAGSPPLVLPQAGLTPVLQEKVNQAATGEVVADIGPSCWVIFQDKDDNYWFGSDGNGVVRFDGKGITRFTTKDGLVHDQIRGIQQHGPTGHILITTNEGVSRYDGKTFTTLPITEMKPPSALGPPMPGAIAGDAVNEGWVLNADDLWMTGAGGPRRYNGKALYQLKFPKSPLEDELGAKYGHSAQNWKSYDVWTVYKDSRGHMWFGTAVFGIARFDGQHIDWMFESHLTEFDKGGWFGFRAIIEDRHGDYWFNSSQYRYKVQPAPQGIAGLEAGKLKYTREKGMDWSAVDTTDKFIHFQSVTQDSNGDLWMSTYTDGVWRHDGKKGTHYPLTVGEPPEPPEEIKIISISTDNHGDIWVATQGHGPYKLNGKAFERFAPVVGPITEPQRKNDPYFTPTGARITSYMPKVIIRNIRQDHAGNIWFATFGGPIRYDGKEFRNFSEEVGLPTTRVFSLLEDRRGALWIGSITGGVSSYDGNTFRKFTVKEGLASNDVHWIFEDRDSRIWFGTTNGVSRYDGKAAGDGTFTNFSTKDGLLHNAVYTIGQDASGRMWFGTQGGICSYDGQSFTNFAEQAGTTFSNVRAMAMDKSGNLWFGGEGGAYRYDGKTLTTFTSRSGLLEDFVGSILVDRAGNVWLGHPGAGRQGGASRYDGTSFKHFTQNDGLNSTNVYAMMEDSAGNIWFGSVDAGACRFDGKAFIDFSTPAGALLIPNSAK